MVYRLQRITTSLCAALCLLGAAAAHCADLVLQTGSFEHDGERFYYESVGSGDAIVLSHGAGGTHACGTSRCRCSRRSIA